MMGVAGAARASSTSESVAGANGRGLEWLDGREAILTAQSRQAAQIARTRGLQLYRLLRARAQKTIDEPAGAPAARGRSVSLATSVLARDLQEARTLRLELDRVRGERSAFAEIRAAESSAAPGRMSSARAGAQAALRKPVDGGLVAPFGVARDPDTGAWFFRAAASFSARPSEVVRAPALARVVSVGEGTAGGIAVVLDPGNGTTMILDGLEKASVASGDVVAGGGRLGNAGGGSEASARPIPIEIWRDRTPIDPAPFLHARVPPRN